MKRFLLLVLFAIVPTLNAAQNIDADFGAVAEEFIKGYLNARPLLATRLGFHEYDGRADDFSRLALDAELQRLRRFEDRLRKFEPEELNARNGIDLRILQAAIANELFEFQDVHKFERNPMTYAHSADFLRKDMVTAVDTVKDQELRANFIDASRRAASALSDFANWLEKEKLPKATPNFALGEAKYQRWLTETELVDLPPAKILEIGLAKLKEEQQTFADAAKIIDPNKSPAEVFKEIQKDHPGADKLIPDIAKNLDHIRGYVTEHKIVGIPPNAKAQVRETPQYDRATSFASMDTPGPFEKKATEAFYYVTPVEPNWSEQQKEEWLTSFNYYTADLTSIHEAYPGHYVQFLRLNASSANKIEKIFGSYAFIEGWAHYCEQMMLDQGFGGHRKPPETAEEQKRVAKYKMAQASEALLRLCRLCVSVKMHTQEM